MLDVKPCNPVVKGFIGGVLIAFAVADFALSYAGVNLTSFLGPASRFSPIVIGLIGGALLNFKE